MNDTFQFHIQRPPAGGQPTDVASALLNRVQKPARDSGSDYSGSSEDDEMFAPLNPSAPKPHRHKHGKKRTPEQKLRDQMIAQQGQE
jgi:hypothetical protein